MPWHEIDPSEEVWPEEPEEPGYGELLPTLGPASRSGAPPYNPMSVQGPGIDPGGYSLLAEKLSWKI